VFASGVVTGIGLSSWCASARRQPPPGIPYPYGDLDLSHDQKQQIQAIMEEHRPEIEEILRGTFPQIREITQAIDEEIRPLLTPEQLEEFEMLRADEHRGPFQGFPPLPPPGAPPAP
jgi:Spy/CpxP family protein refolding chaperone